MTDPETAGMKRSTSDKVWEARECHAGTITYGWEVVEVDTRRVVAETLIEEDAHQIVDEHNAAIEQRKAKSND